MNETITACIGRHIEGSHEHYCRRHHRYHRAEQWNDTNAADSSFNFECLDTGKPQITGAQFEEIERRVNAALRQAIADLGIEVVE